MGTPDGPAGEQLELVRAGGARRRRPAGPPAELVAAAALPVARVALDVPLPHLDRLFDYLVPQALDDAARPGVRVRVRLAGQDVDGFVVERVATSEHAGRLMPLRRVVSAEIVLSPEVLRLARAVADRYAGTLADVLRLAVPPRHARTEQAERPAPAESAPTAQPARVPEPAPWGRYPAGPAFLARLAAGGAPRAVWTALAGPEHWADALAQAVRTTVDAGRGALVVVPDHRDLAVLERAVAGRLAPADWVRLEADLGVGPRYAAFLRALRGEARVVLGTRAAALAPVDDLGLVVVWDDGDEQHSEPRAPYPHVREVLALRAEQSAAAMLVAGWSRTAEAAALLRSGWAREIAADRADRRAAWARVVVAADDPHGGSAAQGARMPPVAWGAVRDGLVAGPVLVQVPRSGYLPGLSCQSCRRAARCPHCTGPALLRLARHDPECAWCGRTLTRWTCPHCEGTRLRARAVGVDRTAEELGRAFPGHRVVVSRAARRLPRVPDAGVLVLATPGIEPVPPTGYAAAVLLDGDVLLERADLRAGEEALRRWLAAAALVRPASRGGRVVVCADPAAPAVTALVRLDAAGFAERELAERAELGLPPAVVAATVTGPAGAVQALVDAARCPEGTQALGPVVVEPAQPARPGAAGAAGTDPEVRMLLRAPLQERAALARALKEASATRSARREPGVARVRLDPADIG